MSSPWPSMCLRSLHLDPPYLLLALLSAPFPLPQLHEVCGKPAQLLQRECGRPLTSSSSPHLTRPLFVVRQVLVGPDWLVQTTPPHPTNPPPHLPPTHSPSLLTHHTTPHHTTHHTPHTTPTCSSHCGSGHPCDEWTDVMRRKQRREEGYWPWDQDPRQRKERRPVCNSKDLLTRENCTDCEKRRPGLGLSDRGRVRRGGDAQRG